MLHVVLVDCFYWFCVWELGEVKDSVSLVFVRSSQQVGRQFLVEGAVPWVCYCKQLPSTEEPVQALASCVYPAHRRCGWATVSASGNKPGSWFVILLPFSWSSIEQIVTLESDLCLMCFRRCLWELVLTDRGSLIWILVLLSRAFFMALFFHYT